MPDVLAGSVPRPSPGSDDPVGVDDGFGDVDGSDDGPVGVDDGSDDFGDFDGVDDGSDDFGDFDGVDDGSDGVLAG
ncbi:hypothetical protein OF117_14855 [Geodermatophilus sp. YIM 151500]|uniref:hypothetical protein n=1 Tax=Geodermatophilus sp. YIM 151500 TaxID=2984531 RepID=UPI0021E419CD|nr:hypothetical protein [Geodermatophilus sp. YIM 151500]MCV2490640.1 hypothetical protein [Geodermatophilus sp. YIM 151500]